MKDIVRAFPCVVKTGQGTTVQGVSVHLCATDIRRLGPDPTREITIWLTLVDLSVLNPVNVVNGKTMTMPHGIIDHRPPYVVKGEVAFLPTEEERQAEEDGQVIRTPAEDDPRYHAQT